MDWNRDNVLHFLSLIRERPVIWNAQCQEYRNKQKKNDAFEEVALLMGCSIKMVNTKWISMKNQFSREKRNMTGSGADTIYTTKWYAFKEMESLMDGSAPQQTYNNLDYSEIRKRPPCFVSVNQDRGEQSSKTNQQGDALRIEKPVVKDRIITKQWDSKSKEKDEYTTYGELVAMKLKKIGNSYARSTAQYHINNILYKAEIGEYDKHPRQSKSFTSKEHFRAGSPSAHHDSNYDVQSQRSSSTKSMDYNLKFEEIDNEESDE